MRGNYLKRYMRSHEGGNGNEENIVTKGFNDGKVHDDNVVTNGEKIIYTSEKNHCIGKESACSN